MQALILLSAMAHLSAGCRPDLLGRGGGQSGGANPHANSSMIAIFADSLRFEIDVPAQVRTGEPVPITLRATNGGEEPLELYLRGRMIAFDITVAREDGSVVWRRLEGQMIPAILQVRELAPGESLEFHDEWNQRTKGGEPVSSGRYTVQGALLRDNPRPLKTPIAPLQILPH